MILGPNQVDSARPARQTDARRLRLFVIRTARLLQDLRCQEVVAFDVRGLSDITDYILIGSGTSDRQIQAAGRQLQDAARAAGLTPYGRQIDTPATWSVFDFVDVVVHLFDPATRAHYDLEMMWGDAVQVRWQRRRSEAGSVPRQGDLGAADQPH